MTERVLLTQGKVALISNHQYERVSKHKWSANYSRGKWYAIAKIKGKSVKLHRFLMNVTDPKIEVDHWNSDSLDCRDENLRMCTHKDNVHNQAIRKDSTTGFKGVHWSKRNKKFVARIQVDGKRIYLGFFRKAKDAARAYDQAAKLHYGEFAKVNL